MSPVYERYKEAASLLAEAKQAEDARRPPGWGLKLNSRKLRTDDWIVWTHDLDTLAWLDSFFKSEIFSSRFKATLISERGTLVKYTIGVSSSEAERPFREVLEFLFKDLQPLGYVRFHDEQKRYKDPEDIAAQKEAKARKQEYHGTGDYDKMIWIKMSKEAHRKIEANEHLLAIFYRTVTLDVTRVTDLPDETPMRGKRRKLGPRPGTEAERAALRERVLEGTGNAPLSLHSAASISNITIGYSYPLAIVHENINPGTRTSDQLYRRYWRGR